MIRSSYPFPRQALYREDTDRDKKFREYDHPLGFYDLSKNEQEILLKWCKRLRKIKTFNLRHTSYGLKHFFKNDREGFSVTNGAFKGAMILSGFQILDEQDLNWNFNVSENSLKKIVRKAKKERRNEE